MSVETILDLVSRYGYLMIFFLLAVGILGIPVPDETLLTFVGYLSFRGDLQIIPSIVAAGLGSLCGITLSYVLGGTGGVSLLNRYGRFFRMDQQRVNRIHNWFERMGKWVLVFGYFVPGVRHLTAFLAGTYRIRYSTFALFAYAGGCLWSGFFFSVGFFGGKEWDQLRGKFHHTFLIGSAVLLVVVLVFYLWRRKLHIRFRKGAGRFREQ